MIAAMYGVAVVCLFSRNALLEEREVVYFVKSFLILAWSTELEDLFSSAELSR